MRYGIPFIFGRVVSVAALCVASATAASAATTWNVPGSGSNVCTTGNPNCNTISQAVSASTNGDTILVGAGTFSGAANSNLVLTKSLTITGAGRTNTIIQPTTVGFSVRASGISISDLTLQGGTVGVIFTNAASNNTQLSRINFDGNTTRGIDFTVTPSFPVTNVAIDDCSFAVLSTMPGIRMSSQSQINGLTITNSSFTGNKYGIYQANDGNTSKLSNFTIDTCTFTNNSDYAIYTEEMRDVTIEDSTFTNNKVAILLLKIYTSSGVGASNITIQRNQFTQTAGTAVDLEVLSGGLENGITIVDNTIAMNVSLMATNASAIFVALTHTATHAPVTMTDNTITMSGTFGAANAAYGIRMRRNGPVVLTGNSIDGGGVGGNGSASPPYAPASSGLFIESANSATSIMPASTTITGTCNRITGFKNGVSVYDSFNGVYGGLVAGATVTLNDNDITGNTDNGVVNGAVSATVGAQGNWWGCPAGPGNPGCDGVVGAVDASTPDSAPEPCVPCTSAAQCDDDNPCTVDTCSSNCANTPGNGGATCRAAAGACDLVETCDGTNAACPPDVKSTAPCRASAGVCDLAEVCDGVNDACPADGKSTAVCRPGAGICDVAESCDGVSDACPADGFVAASTPCRAAAGVCDIAESCTGASAACPADGKSTAVCRASADVCDIADSCDGVNDTCPADAKSSAVCRPSSGVCDVADSCNGVSDTCPADASQPDGSSCSDGLFCNGAEVCQSGTCQTGSDPCTQLCNEGTDACEAGCLPAPQVCRPAAKSILLVKDKDDNSKDKLIWKWIKGQATSQAEFADPLSTADYALCIYAGTTSGLVAQALIPASPTNWRQLGSKGYKYGDASGTPNGITKAILKGSAQNKAKALVKGKGADLPDLTLPLVGPVTVQLVNGDSGLCFGADYSGAQLLKNQAGQLKAKAQ